MRAGAVLLGVALAMAPAGAARAEPPIQPAAAPAPAASAAAVMRTGNHPGFGRVVFDLPAGATWSLDRAGDRLTVRFTGATVGAGARPPRNVRDIVTGPGKVEFMLAPGAQIRPVRNGDRLVLDVLDPAAVTPAPPTPATPPPTPSTPAPLTPVAPPPAPTNPAAMAAAVPRGAAPVPLLPGKPSRPVPLPQAAVPAAPVLPPPPAPARAVPAEAPPAGPVALIAAPGPGLLLPFAAGTGAAAFRRGDEAVLVFDERRPIDTASLHGDPQFGTAEVRLLSTATVLRLHLPADRALSLSREEAGWTVVIGGQPTLRPIRPELESLAGGTAGSESEAKSGAASRAATGATPGADSGAASGARLRMAAASPGRTVVVPDPLTGGTLLVGTQREPGQGVAVARSTPEFIILPTWQGVAVVAISDELVLRQIPEGFVLASAVPGGGLALAPAGVDLDALAAALPLTRRYDFPALPLPALLRRLQAAVAGAAASPAGERSAPRIATAQAMLALGLAAEAEAGLSLAADSDPRAADDADLAGLSAIAALLAGRPDESAGLDDPRLTGTDEIALWRALRTAMLREGAPEAASVLATEMPLLLAYPAPLRSRLLPLAAETMALGGEAEAARRLAESRPDDAGLDFARALLAEPRDRQAALVILDRLAQSPDRLLRARAAPRAVELRLAAGDLTPAAAAEAMEKLLLVWRGDGREVALRLRAADLHALAGTPRPALAVLREALDGLPDQREVLRARMAAIFAAAIAADAAKPLPPLDLVALAEENPDLMPEGDAGLALAGRLAESLAALDLPRRAAPVLEKLVAASPAGVVRAELGGQLAATRQLLGDSEGALSALGATAIDTLPPPVLEARVLTWARATAALGDAARAAAALETLDTPAALELRGRLLEKAKDWNGAAAALRRYADRMLPAEGALTEPQGVTLLRLATAAAQAGDEVMLARLRDHDLARMPPGRTADMFRMLTSTPVELPEDLPRARHEAALAGGLLGAPGR